VIPSASGDRLLRGTKSAPSYVVLSAVEGLGVATILLIPAAWGSFTGIRDALAGASIAFVATLLLLAKGGRRGLQVLWIVVLGYWVALSAGGASSLLTSGVADISLGVCALLSRPFLLWSAFALPLTIVSRLELQGLRRTARSGWARALGIAWLAGIGVAYYVSTFPLDVGSKPPLSTLSSIIEAVILCTLPPGISLWSARRVRAEVMFPQIRATSESEVRD
jgi:hypothetical protein